MDNIDNNIWEILGIPETKDEKKITQAYRDRLPDNNPEEKPEEFKQLRSAYEEALTYAKRPETAADKQIDEWLKDLNDLYNDFSRRKMVENWEARPYPDICGSRMSS